MKAYQKITGLPQVFGIPVFPIFGSDPTTMQGGYHTAGDIVTVTNDGVDLNALWGIYQDSLEIYNDAMDRLSALFTFPVTNPIETVPQVGEATFEEATEFGEPRSNRIELDYFQLGYDFRDYDTATRYTWKFLRDADTRQIDAVHREVLRADRRLVFRKIMEAIFDNRNRVTDIRNQNFNVYPLYNGDGTVPPSYKGNNFDGSHNHYLVSGNTTIDSSDVEDAYTHIAHHGFGIENGTVFVMLCNAAQVKEMRKWRAGQVSANGVVANYDFIPAANQPTMILPNAEGLLGSLPPDNFKGLRVVGSYADILIVEESYIPQGYFLIFGTGGAANLQNLVGIREHANPAYRGLRLLPGNQQRYPLIDGYYARSFGTGIRQRAGAVVVQLKASGTYDIPQQYRKTTGALL